MSGEKVHVVLAADANYEPGLRVTRESLLKSCARPERLALHVFGDNDLAGCDVSVFDAWNCGSRMTYLRLFLPSLLPTLDYAIYSDVDVVWDRDVCELWDEFVRKGDGRLAAIQWVRDLPSVSTHVKYGCAGVCVLNLRKLRETDLAAKAVAYVKAHGTPPFADQGVLNELLKDDCALLPTHWDVLGNWADLPCPGERCVYHLTGVGRHFHDAAPPTYPPQYQLWWNVAHGRRDVAWRSRVLAAFWPLRFLARLLPAAVCERVVRQWFFARVLAERFAGGAK